jgi:uncharacterized membrane protein YeaQ/YmgE (transglycosylase-associated protein family)
MESKLAQLAVALCGAVVGGAVGFGAPMLFDRDVGGALAASVLGIIGIPVGWVIATFLVRRHND